MMLNSFCKTRLSPSVILLRVHKSNCQTVTISIDRRTFRVLLLCLSKQSQSWICSECRKDGLFPNFPSRRSFRTHLVSCHRSDLERVRGSDGTWYDRIVRISGARLCTQQKRVLLRSSRPQMRRIIYQSLRLQNGHLLPASSSEGGQGNDSTCFSRFGQGSSSASETSLSGWKDPSSNNPELDWDVAEVPVIHLPELDPVGATNSASPTVGTADESLCVSSVQASRQDPSKVVKLS
jgi:hypothetical protein